MEYGKCTLRCRLCYGAEVAEQVTGPPSQMFFQHGQVITVGRLWIVGNVSKAVGRT
jgi:hypothetical protein